MPELLCGIGIALFCSGSVAAGLCGVVLIARGVQAAFRTYGSIKLPPVEDERPYDNAQRELHEWQDEYDRRHPPDLGIYVWCEGRKRWVKVTS